MLSGTIFILQPSLAQQYLLINKNNSLFFKSKYLQYVLSVRLIFFQKIKSPVSNFQFYWNLSWIKLALPNYIFIKYMKQFTIQLWICIFKALYHWFGQFNAIQTVQKDRHTIWFDKWNYNRRWSRTPNFAKNSVKCSKKFLFSILHIYFEIFCLLEGAHNDTHY